ncbi:MAG: DUF397 domain-containing protein [Pseudonocardiales bacterium]|nr:DUF397 domain-containing protein [Pseudonocardiales bacterium]MBW0008743.1 DUF397 domain-containing protein [Pseudonocardiales bacterium]
MPTAHRRAGWRKSTYSAQADGCVEVDLTSEGVEIRHNKVIDSPVISFTGEQWSRWLGEVVSEHLTGTNGAVTVLGRTSSWTVREELDAIPDMETYRGQHNPDMSPCRGLGRKAGAGARRRRWASSGMLITTVALRGRAAEVACPLRADERKHGNRDVVAAAAV